jgi:hypothetical protein
MVKPIFSRYFRKFLVTTPSTEITMGYAHILLSFQEFFISRAKLSYFIIFSVSFGKVIGQGNCCIYYECCFSISINEHYIRSVEI